MKNLLIKTLRNAGYSVDTSLPFSLFTELSRDLGENASKHFIFLYGKNDAFGRLCPVSRIGYELLKEGELKDLPPFIKSICLATEKEMEMELLARGYSFIEHAPSGCFIVHNQMEKVFIPGHSWSDCIVEAFAQMIPFNHGNSHPRVVYLPTGKEGFLFISPLFSPPGSIDYADAQGHYWIDIDGSQYCVGRNEFIFCGEEEEKKVFPLGENQ